MLKLLTPFKNFAYKRIIASGFSLLNCNIIYYTDGSIDYLKNNETVWKTADQISNFIPTSNDDIVYAHNSLYGVKIVSGELKIYKSVNGYEFNESASLATTKAFTSKIVYNESSDCLHVLIYRYTSNIELITYDFTTETLTNNGSITYSGEAGTSTNVLFSMIGNTNKFVVFRGIAKPFMAAPFIRGEVSDGALSYSQLSLTISSGPTYNAYYRSLTTNNDSVYLTGRENSAHPAIYRIASTGEPTVPTHSLPSNYVTDWRNTYSSKKTTVFFTDDNTNYDYAFHKVDTSTPALSNLLYTFDAGGNREKMFAFIYKNKNTTQQKYFIKRYYARPHPDRIIIIFYLYSLTGTSETLIKTITGKHVTSLIWFGDDPNE